MRAALQMDENGQDWRNAAIGVSNLSETELFVGEVAAAVATAEQSVAYADRSGDEFQMMGNRAILAERSHSAGRARRRPRRYLPMPSGDSRNYNPGYPCSIP